MFAKMSVSFLEIRRVAHDVIGHFFVSRCHLPIHRSLRVQPRWAHISFWPDSETACRAANGRRWDDASRQTNGPRCGRRQKDRQKDRQTDERTDVPSEHLDIKKQTNRHYTTNQKRSIRGACLSHHTLSHADCIDVSPDLEVIH